MPLPQITPRERKAYKQHWRKTPTGQACEKRKENRLDRKESVYKRSAKVKGHEWSFNTKQLEWLLTQPCSYCGVITTPFGGIDRVDNSKGYTEDNVLPCCKPCNYWKSTDSLEVFCQRLVQTRDRINELLS